jgi:acyl carrier protein
MRIFFEFWNPPMTSEEKMLRSEFDLPEAYVAPQTPMEVQMAKIWCEAIGIDQLGLLDSFFDICDKSFPAAVIFSQIEERFGISLPITDLLEFSTVGALAARIDELTRERVSPPP